MFVLIERRSEESKKKLLTQLEGRPKKCEYPKRHRHLILGASVPFALQDSHWHLRMELESDSRLGPEVQHIVREQAKLSCQKSAPSPCYDPLFREIGTVPSSSELGHCFNGTDVHFKSL